MAFAAGGALAAAVTRAGGLGLIGGGYGDAEWLEQQFAAAEGERVGVGFITWSLQRTPSLLSQVLRHRPAAVMLSFGDPRPFAEEIRRAGAVLVCQCQEMAHVAQALEAGAGIVVAPCPRSRTTCAPRHPARCCWPPAASPTAAGSPRPWCSVPTAC
ncbi:MAG TPA: hypothetical protein VGD76_03735 [Ramlibacter sp.]